MSVCKLDCNEDILLREFLKYMRCSIILEGCNETLHNGVTELHNGSSIILLGEYNS